MEQAQDWNEFNVFKGQKGQCGYNIENQEQNLQDNFRKRRVKGFTKEWLQCQIIECKLENEMREARKSKKR